MVFRQNTNVLTAYSSILTRISGHIPRAERMMAQYVYFVHSFFAENCDDSLSAVTQYGIPITAAVEQGNVYGCQFHPEKSGNVGLNILRKFAEV